MERWIIKRGRWPKITMEDYTGNGVRLECRQSGFDSLRRRVSFLKRAWCDMIDGFDLRLRYRFGIDVKKTCGLVEIRNDLQCDLTCDCLNNASVRVLYIEFLKEV